MKGFDSTFWRHHLRDGLNAPLHILALSGFVSLFGNLRTRIAFDLFERRPYSFGILKAADEAAKYNIPSISAVEFGVASGRGLLSMCRIAKAVSVKTGVAIEVIGFDIGSGMPPAADYRDHPEYYFQGDYALPQVSKLLKSLPKYARLIIGDVADTVPRFLSDYEGVIGFVAVDVDYYTSTKSCLGLLTDRPDKYLPCVPIYFDDVLADWHNPWCGEQLAFEEFNGFHSMRKIAPYTALANKRIMKNASWIPQMYALHVLDHKLRSVSANKPDRPRSVPELGFYSHSGEMGCVSKKKEKILPSTTHPAA